MLTVMEQPLPEAKQESMPPWKGSVLDYKSPFRFRGEDEPENVYPINTEYCKCNNHNKKN
jgi:hypothetical protein